LLAWFKANDKLADRSSTIWFGKPLGTCWGGFEIEQAALDQGRKSLVGNTSKRDDMDKTLAGLAGPALSLNVSGVRGECVSKDEKVVRTLSDEAGVEGAAVPCR
jgi:hypothetical protein